jgi:hypothetical protein
MLADNATLIAADTLLPFMSIRSFVAYCVTQTKAVKAILAEAQARSSLGDANSRIC